MTYDFVRTLSGAHGRAAPSKRSWRTSGPRLKKKRDALPEKWGKLGVSDAVIARAQESNATERESLCGSYASCTAGFRATRFRFCTGELKIEPIEHQVYKPIQAAGDSVCVWLGLRRAESVARRDLKTRQRINGKSCTYRVFRPILDWSFMDVMQKHAQHGIKANPLYAQGFTRVGCFPCIYARKSEIRLIADQFPEAIDKLEKWEAIVNEATRSDSATFFNTNRDPKFELKDGEKYSDHGIRKIVEWSRTAYGGKQFDLIQPKSRERQEMDEACNETGVCE